MLSEKLLSKDSDYFEGNGRYSITTFFGCQTNQNRQLDKLRESL